MSDLKELMEQHYLEYASYVILERAIPKVVDGLKPVQRRILYTLWQMDDGKLHKVANIVGQAMKLHPHGDAPIYDALVNLANKGYLIDRQGNFGNPYTGDPASAARYIEARLSPLARETLFNPKITETLPSYDGRAQEPVHLPAKIPLLLMQGAEGIAVGMATKIFPHNFVELLEAEIAILQKKSIQVLPDFPTGGTMDASEYKDGKGKIKLRARIDLVNDKTLVIREICYGTNTESVIRSIDEAAKKGRIKIDSINDYTAEHVEIEIKLPRGHYAKELIPALYAYTDCEISLSTQMVAIEGNLPAEVSVSEILTTHADLLKDYLRQELEIEREMLLEKVFFKSLERLFIEKRMYKQIEELKTNEAIHAAIEKSLKPYHKKLLRIPAQEDREKLLSIPIRRISRFDIDKNKKEIAEAQTRIDEIEKKLRNLTRHTIAYLKHLIKKYGQDYPRRTQLTEMEEIDKRAISEKQVKVGFDIEHGFIGTKVKGENAFECSNLDKLLLMFKDGSYKVMNIPEKQYVHDDGKQMVYAGVADKKTVMSALYTDPKTKIAFGKRFVVDKFILDKEYRFMEEGMKLEFLTTTQQMLVKLQFKPKPRQSVKKQELLLEEIPLKGVKSKGKRLSPKEVKKVSCAQLNVKNNEPPKDLFEAAERKK